MPLIRPAITEAGVLGAAILAGYATNLFPRFSDGIKRFVQTSRIFEPDMETGRIYQERFALYRKFFPAIRSFLADLSAIGNR